MIVTNNKKMLTREEKTFPNYRRCDFRGKRKVVVDAIFLGTLQVGHMLTGASGPCATSHDRETYIGNKHFDVQVKVSSSCNKLLLNKIT